MGEPATRESNKDDIEALGGERLESIWSELDVWFGKVEGGNVENAEGNVDVDTGAGKVEGGNLKNVDGNVEDGRNVNRVGPTEIDAAVWTREEANDSVIGNHSKMDGLVKVKEEPIEVLSQQGVVLDLSRNGNNVNGVFPRDTDVDVWTSEEVKVSMIGHYSKMDGFVKVKEEPIDVLSQQGVPDVGRNGPGLMVPIFVKEEKVIFEKGKEERGVTPLNEGTGGGVKVKEEAITQDGSQVGDVRGSQEDIKMDEVEQPTGCGIAEGENVDLSRQDNEEQREIRGSLENLKGQAEDIIRDNVEQPSDCGIGEGENVDLSRQDNEEQRSLEDIKEQAEIRGSLENMKEQVEIRGSLEDIKMDEVEQPADFAIAGGDNADLPRQDNEEEATAMGGIPNQSADAGKEVGTEVVLWTMPGEEEIREMEFDTLQKEPKDAEVWGFLKDGVLSADGLEKMGMVLTDESSSEEESKDTSSSEEESKSSEEEDDSESDGSTDESSSSEDEDMKAIKEKIRRSTDETKEDTEPPRTKHEVAVLPPVPKVEACLEPHHVCVSIGAISSVMDLYIVVEGKGGSKVLSDGSILWLSESRIPLGIVDEVFGPVKKPYYSLRFNEVSDIAESAKIGTDVAYVAEFAEFVLKDNPNLYQKAVDASGLDDEELSDAEIEFSDDEKEIAARRGKRGYDFKENGGQAWDGSEFDARESKGRWQRRERGRWRGYSRGGGYHTAEGVDFAMADMDLHGSRFNAGYHRGRARARARPGAGRSKPHNNARQSTSGVWDGPDLRVNHSRIRQSSPGLWDGQDFGTTHSRLHHGQVSRGDWPPSPTRHSPGAGPSASGPHHQIPLPRRDERRDERWDERRDASRYSEQVDLGDRQAHQGIGNQGHLSFGVPPLPRHVQGPGAEPRQQGGSAFPSFGYSSVAAPQIATDGQGNFFHIAGPVNLPPDVGNVGRLGMNVGPTRGSVLPPTSPNSYTIYNTAVQGSMNARQGGYDHVYEADLNYRGQQHGGFVGPSPGYSNRLPAAEIRFQAMPSNSPTSGRGGAGGPQGYARGSPPRTHRERRYQGSYGR